MSAGGTRITPQSSVFAFNPGGFPKPTHPTLWRRIKAAVTGLGYCLRCGDPWTGEFDGHSTDFGDGACFPLCETCWASLVPVERMPYYDALADSWAMQARNVDEKADVERKRRAIFLAVMNGG